jgi:hypothetical protein
MDDAFFKILPKSVRYIWSSVFPQRKKSMGVKSGDLAGHTKAKKYFT